MTLTTAGLPPAGIYWQAVILSYLELNLSPQFGMKTIPGTALNIGLTPTLQMLVPGKAGLRLSPTLKFSSWTSTRTTNGFNLALSPSLMTRASTESTVGLTLTPVISMTGRLLLRGGQVNTAVQRAATI